MIRVLKAGLSSIQDLGRYGSRSIGVPVSGVMDAHSAALANQLVGNPLNTPVIEFTAIGPTLYFEQNAVISVTGASFGIFVNKIEKPLNKVIKIEAGDTIKFTPPKKGWRGYLAIHGGFDTEVILGSKSMYAGITKKGKIDANDILNINTTSEILNANENVLIPLDFSSKIITIYKGPEYEILDKNRKTILKNDTFKIHQNSNRMATQIDGLGEVRFKDIFTVPVQPGTVQLTPSGKLLVLMRDAQTTGGYPRIFQLTKNSFNILAQKRPNEVITFQILD